MAPTKEARKPPLARLVASKKIATEYQAVSLELRKLYDRYPEVFEACVRGLQLYEDNWRKVILPPVDLVRGKPVIPAWVLAMLLTQYRTRPSGESREDFIARMADSGLWLGGPYIITHWDDTHTVTAHLKAAEKKEKADLGFADSVRICLDWVASHSPDAVPWPLFEFVHFYAQQGLRLQIVHEAKKTK